MTDPKRTDSPATNTSGEKGQQRPDAPPAIADNVEETPVSYGFVATAATLMFLGVWAFVHVLNQAATPSHSPKPVAQPVPTTETKRIPTNSMLVAMQAAPASTQVGANDIREERKLSTFYQRRAYLGAPPRIPHPITEKLGQMENCLSCHRKGGYVPKYQAYTPVTPHPTYTNCVQCHLPQNTKTLFKPTTWTKMEPPKLRRTPLPGGPPPIPHTLHLRTNCNACHAGPGSVRMLRTPHPDRTNCLQCHLPRSDVKAFQSAYQIQLVGSNPTRQVPEPRRATSRPTTQRR